MAEREMAQNALCFAAPPGLAKPRQRIHGHRRSSTQIREKPNDGIVSRPKCLPRTWNHGMVEHWHMDFKLHMLSSLLNRKLKTHIRELYARLANVGTANLSQAPIASGESLARALGYDTSRLPIPEKAWELFAGCGNPLEEIDLEPDWTVMDLGCGVGVDSQVAALSLRPPGRVIGIDITAELLRLAKNFAREGSGLHYHCMVGDGEQLPLQDESVHLTIANGSFNLMPQKKQALAEIYRVLKPGGYLALADLVLVGKMEPITAGFEDAWAWCVAGALSAGDYNTLLPSIGFSWWQVSIKSSYGPLASAHVIARRHLCR